MNIAKRINVFHEYSLFIVIYKLLRYRWKYRLNMRSSPSLCLIKIRNYLIGKHRDYQYQHVIETRIF